MRNLSRFKKYINSVVTLGCNGLIVNEDASANVVVNSEDVISVSRLVDVHSADVLPNNKILKRGYV